MKNIENDEVLQGNSLEKEEQTSLKIEIKTFISDSLGSLRTAYDNYGRPVICLKDACSILDIKNPSDAKGRLKASGVVRLTQTDGKKFHNYLYITEDNLYRLIFQSRKEEAVLFMDWVTEVVLPSIGPSRGKHHGGSVGRESQSRHSQRPESEDLRQDREMADASD